MILTVLNPFYIIYCEHRYFRCIHFRGFVKMGNFACIKIRVLCKLKVIFEMYIFSRIFKKRKLLENLYSAKISTFTVYQYENTCMYFYY